MKLKLSTALVLLCFIFIGCAITPNRQAIGTTYTSDVPPLEVEFAYQISNVKNSGNDKLLTLYTTEVRDVWVELYKINVIDNKVDYFYSLERIAHNNNFQYFGPIYFEEHQWVKVADVTDKGWLMCGYLTRKDKWMIFIHNSYELDDAGIERYREYQRTLKLSESDRQFIDKQFANLNKAIVSIK